jgi:RNA polymerase-binding transcription factor DksA
MMNPKARNLEPEMLNEFAQLLQERRNKLAPPFTQNSKAMWALWSIVHEREVRDIDGALARIRMGSYGTCADCGGSIQFLRLYQDPTVSSCLVCCPQSQTRRMA